MSPAVSVVIPTYNHRDLVPHTLDSVFAQRFDDYEVIVVDDGSPDDTAAVLRPLIDAGRIRYLEQPNAGQGAARNRGLRAARGEFVAFLDDDDLWPVDKLAWQVEILQRDSAAVLVYGRHAELRRGGRIVPDDKTGFPAGEVFRRFRLRNWIHSPGQTLIRRSALERAGGFDASIWGADDWDLYVRLARAGRFAFRDRIALHYRVHGGNASRRAVMHAINDLRVMRKHAGGNLPLIVRHMLLAGDYFAPNLLQSAERAAAAGDSAAARRAALLALAYKPTLLARWRNAARLARLVSGRPATAAAVPRPRQPDRASDGAPATAPHRSEF